MIPREHILEDINKYNNNNQQKNKNQPKLQLQPMKQHLQNNTSSTSMTTSNNSSSSTGNKMSFEEEFPSLIESSNNNKKKNKIPSLQHQQQRTSRPSSPNNIQYQQSSSSTSSPQSLSPSQSTKSSQYISKYIDVSDHDGDDSSVNSWKKRDLLYYCFIQRHHEVTTIANFIEGVARLYGLVSDITLLDIGCGLGRMFSEWDRRKIFGQVDAMEPDLDYWTFASDHAMNTSDKVTVIHGGFMDISIKNKYKMCVCIHGPFQYLLRLEDKLEALRRIWVSLQPGGVILLDVSNFLMGLSQLRTQTESKVLVNGIPVKRVSNIEVDFHNSIWRLQDLFFSVDSPMDPDEIGNGYGDGQYIVEHHQFSIYTLSEIQLLLASTGFQNIRSTSKYCVQDLYQIPGTPIVSDGPRLIVMAQKPFNQSPSSPKQ